MSTRIDIEGQRFGKLKVLSFYKTKNTHAIWNVICDCGKKFMTSCNNLKSKNTTSCQSCGQKTHGLSKTSYHRKWENLRSNHKNNTCSEWYNFVTFKNDTYNTFKEGYRIKRKDINKIYSKENCYWNCRLGKNDYFQVKFE